MSGSLSLAEEKLFACTKVRYQGFGSDMSAYHSRPASTRMAHINPPSSQWSRTFEHFRSRCTIELLCYTLISRALLPVVMVNADQECQALNYVPK